jgi:hypothetical protein
MEKDHPASISFFVGHREIAELECSPDPMEEAKFHAAFLPGGRFLLMAT